MSHLPQNKHSAFFLVGPTAVGKTTVSHAIAARLGYEILSADSMLVYRGMDIGTAKPTSTERQQVRYEGLDLVPAGAQFSVGAYHPIACAAVQSAADRNVPLIVVGGTGLYVKCLTDGLVPLPPMNVEVRAAAERILAEGGLGALQAALRALSPAVYDAVADKRNPRRLVRAYERAVSGETRTDRTWKSGENCARIPGLLLPMPQLYAQIEARVQWMYTHGLLDEVRTLRAQGFDDASTARQAIGYAEAIDHLDGRCSIDEAMQVTATRTRHLAKRQLTWFRHQLQVDWIMLDESLPVDTIANRVVAYWREHGPTPITMA